MRQQIPMLAVSGNKYEAANGFSLKRESGLTPNGNLIGDRWVLRDAANAFVDVDAFRHDVMERNGFTPSYPSPRLKQVVAAEVSRSILNRIR